jgi:DNA-binding NarL/FixJ family response regulator
MHDLRVVPEEHRRPPRSTVIPAELVDDVRRGAWRHLHSVAEAVVEAGSVPGLHTTLKQRRDHRASAEATWALLDCLGWSDDDPPLDLDLDVLRHGEALRAALGRARDEVECWLQESSQDSRGAAPRHSIVAARVQALRAFAVSLDRTTTWTAQRESGPISVLLGCFDPLTLHGLDSALAQEHRVRVLATGLRESALEDAVIREAPSVVILDETIEHSLLGRLESRRPAPGVIVLAHDQPLLYRTTPLAAGTIHLARSSSVAQLVTAVHRASLLSGQNVQIEPSLQRLNLLTARELDVLDYLSRGCSYSEISDELHLAVSTLKTHVAHIKRKLGVKNKRALIGIAVPIRRRHRVNEIIESAAAP